MQFLHCSRYLFIFSFPLLCPHAEISLSVHNILTHKSPLDPALICAQRDRNDPITNRSGEKKTEKENGRTSGCQGAVRVETGGRVEVVGTAAKADSGAAGSPVGAVAGQAAVARANGGSRRTQCRSGHYGTD